MSAPPTLSEAVRGVLMSSMSDAGCGMTLGRSAAWVARMRLALKAAAEPAVAGVQAGDRWFAVAPPGMAAEVSEVAQPSPEPRAPRCVVREAIVTENLRVEHDLLCLPPPSARAISARLTTAGPCPAWMRATVARAAGCPA